ncbi:MAG TPA: D-alanyl-D-alanine carboxypeptidase family protein [Acidimicrobiales bacterium]|nr:D-alanyl-D-alanine carboxypeptidase family protein [Acidimicrobiales bacterium]
MNWFRCSSAAALLVGAAAVLVPVLRSSDHPTGHGAPGYRTSRSADDVTGADRSTTTARPAAHALDPGLVAAYERARVAAAGAGKDLVINSGYRTPAYQQQLLDEEVAKRGSFAEANRWVFTPERSMHVQGLAIDVGDGPAADWLVEHGARFGLCHTLGWEWWHFEWRQRWQDSGSCPPPADDPSEAPGV